MVATVFSALVTCAVSLVLGQAVLRLCGWRQWSWLAAPVGVSMFMLLASAALHVPGRAVTCGVVIVLAIAVAAVLMTRERPSTLRPPLPGLVFGMWPFALALLPFAVAGRSGTLGVSLDNDMSAHLLFVEGILSQHVIDVNGIDTGYPLGPHTAVAAIVALTKMPTDQVFAGFTIAVPVLLGWTGLTVAGRGWWRQFAVVAVCGLPYMIASYYGEGAFKEILMPPLVLGFALLLEARRTAATAGPLANDLRRWIPAAVVLAGMASVYSYTAALWPFLLIVLWLGGLAATGLWARGTRFLRHARGAVWGEAGALAIGIGALVVVLIPQLARIARFADSASGGGGVGGGGLVQSATSLVPKGAVGNLITRLSPWEALGMWDNPDFRLGAIDPVGVGIWTGLVLALCVVGTMTWIRRDQWMVPTTAVVGALVWAYLDDTQSIYVAAKAIVILAPFVMLTAAGAFVEQPARMSVGRGLTLLAPIVALVFVYKTTDASVQALRHSPVGPRDHLHELRALRGKLSGRTVFLGGDDFAGWELAGKSVQGGTIATDPLTTRAEKQWQQNHPLDIDTVPATTLNTFDFVLTPRDAVGSALPPQLQRVAQTRSFALYRRVGVIPPRQVLGEGDGPAALLDCRHNAHDRALARRAGTAVVRERIRGVAAPSPLLAGADRTVEIPLPRAGTWDFVLPYNSSFPITVTAPGMAPVVMPPNLDRPGPRYPVGTIHTTGPTSIPFRFRVKTHRLASTAAPAILPALLAVRRGTERALPLRKACGRLVDYYVLGK
jgi:hypothetical protein